jgi:hypothetical protein
MNTIDKKAIAWYHEVNDYCLTLSEVYGVSLIQVSGIMSALSPNNTFASNCKSLERFLQYKGQCKVTTFNGQKRKAQAILDMTKPCEASIKAILSGDKTMSFFENIYRPLTSEAVTVDLWQIRWAKQLKLIPEHGTLTKKRYRLIAQMVRQCASELKLRPHEFQAMTWVQIRGSQY